MGYWYLLTITNLALTVASSVYLWLFRGCSRLFILIVCEANNADSVTTIGIALFIQ